MLIFIKSRNMIAQGVDKKAYLMAIGIAVLRNACLIGVSINSPRI